MMCHYEERLKICHCEERSDEAISEYDCFESTDCFASLAMTCE